MVIKNLVQVPKTLFLLASVCIISTIAVSNIPGGNFFVRVFFALYVLTHLMFILFRRIKFIKPHTVHYIFIAWSFLGIVGGFDTVSLSTLFGKLWTVLQLICMSYFLYALALEMGSIRWLEWNYLAGVFVSMTWVFFSTGGHFEGDRISGTQGNANLFAFVLLISCILSLDLLKFYRGFFVKSALSCNIGIIFPFVLATGSRKGIIGFFLIICCEIIKNIIFQPRGKRLRSVALGALGGGLALAVCIPALTESQYWGRFQNLERFAQGKPLVKQENSLSGRVSLYTRGFELALENPLFGVGLDLFRYYDSTLRMTEINQTYSHSNIIEVLADTGFLGFAIYYSAYALVIYRFLTTRNRGDYLYFCTLLGIIIIFFDIFSVSYYVKEYWLVLTMILCSTEFLTEKYMRSRKQILGNA